MFFDSRHTCSRNFDSVISIDVIGIKSYVDGFFNLTAEPVRVMNLDFSHMRTCPVSSAYSKIAEF